MVPPMMSTIILAILFHFLLCHSWLAFGHAILPRTDPSLLNLDNLLQLLDTSERNEIIGNNDNGHILQPAVLFPESSQTQQDKFRQILASSSSKDRVMPGKNKLITLTSMYNNDKKALTVRLENDYLLKSGRMVLVIGSEGFWICKIGISAERRIRGTSPKDILDNSNAFNYAIRGLVFGQKTEARPVKELEVPNTQQTLTEYIKLLEARGGKVRSVLFISPPADGTTPHFQAALEKSVLDLVKPKSDSLKFSRIPIEREVKNVYAHVLRVDAFQDTSYEEDAQVVVVSYGDIERELAVFPNWYRAARLADKEYQDLCDELLNFD